MPIIEQLVQTIDGHIRELNREIASLQDARIALVGNGAAATTPPEARPKPRRPATRRTPRRNASRTPQVLQADAAERMLGGSDGMTTAALAKQTGAERDQVLALLRDLEAARRVRRTGERRATRWHAITDEDRIRERAAELAARSRRRAR